MELNTFDLHIKMIPRIKEISKAKTTLVQYINQLGLYFRSVYPSTHNQTYFYSAANLI